MSDLLYLDTARLGRISPGAARAQADALRLAADEGGSAYFDRFLRSGLDVLPPGFRDRYPGLTSWAGVGELKQSLRRLAGHRPDLPVLLAARSAALMGFAARLLARLCRNVLTTDLGWPPYHDRLVATARRSGRTVTTLAVRDDALAGRATADEVVDRACRAYADNGCDGLFLTAVGHLGVRFPVERVVRAIESRNRVWFVVVDGAQELGHTGADLAGGFCDLYLAGCHKWVRAHHPLGVGFYGRARSRGVVDGVLARMVAAGDLDDPLLGLSARLEADAPAGGTETANLLPLFAARGAAGDARPAVAPGLAGDLARAAGVAAAAGWRPLVPAPGLRSGILLAEADRAAVRAADPDAVRLRLRELGVSATTYPGGRVRLSLPPGGFAPGEPEHLGQALRRVA